MPLYHALITALAVLWEHTQVILTYLTITQLYSLFFV